MLKCCLPARSCTTCKIKTFKADSVVGLVPTLPSSPPALTRLLLQAVDTGFGDSLSHHSPLALLTHMVTGRSVVIFNCQSPHLEQNGFFPNKNVHVQPKIVCFSLIWRMACNSESGCLKFYFDVVGGEDKLSIHDTREKKKLQNSSC